MAKQKTEIKEYNICQCQTCEDHPEFEHKDMMQHLRDVHGIEPKQTKGRREMLMHADGERRYIWKWKWTLDCGVIFTQQTCNLRSRPFGA